ncbi:MAG: hypothetical protein SFV51_06425 [Bryobacteraceae bacterium]|nr:hypothetical protein [Bryobacteraceae bacterium]
MRLRRGSTKEVITLGNPLGEGGEARVYEVPGHPDLVAKIYHNPTNTDWAKLKVMLANPPEDPTRTQGHTSIAWPVDLLQHQGNSASAGFLMPRLNHAPPVFQYYNPGTRRKQCPGFTYEYLLTTAQNIASAFAAIHARGYVVGDVNQSNVLVSATALATIIDTDSFQVSDPENGSVYRCLVRTDDYTAPELQGVSLESVHRTAEHDAFGLAVMLFQLLMEGFHPFFGQHPGAGEPEPVGELIRKHHFPYARGHTGPYRPGRLPPPLEVLDPGLREKFLLCFEQGGRTPAIRPAAREWREALDLTRRRLATCTRNTHHRFGTHLNTCPWCERAVMLGGRDPFPSPDEIRAQRPGRPPVMPPRPPPAVARPPAPPPPSPPPPVSIQAPPSWIGWIGPAAVAQAAAAFFLLERRPGGRVGDGWQPAGLLDRPSGGGPHAGSRGGNLGGRADARP